ncbi:MAG: hypothetical protein ABIJ47_14195 [Candidatus Bathyarchaeota archaeon]
MAINILTLDMTRRWTGYRVNLNLKVGLVLGVLQFIVFFSKYDHIVQVGPFVAHHFLELPAFFFIGSGFSEFFYDLGWSSAKSQIGGLAIYFFNTLVTTRGLGTLSLVAALIVSCPYLFGFYYHRLLIKGKPADSTQKGDH